MSAIDVEPRLPRAVKLQGAYWEAEFDGETVLGALRECVVTFEQSQDMLEITPGGDSYCGVKMTKAQAQQLITELQALVDKL